MGSINKKCFDKIKLIPGLTLPVDLEVRDKDGRVLGIAVLEPTGEVLACWFNPPKRYGNPSNLRADLIDKNGSTYTQFFYNGRSLREHGVMP